jgi:hypothetical protein
MATAGEKKPSEMTLLDMVVKLETLAKPVVNDRRQKNYCEYITMFLSHFGSPKGGERCMVVGSTCEETRLRLCENEGDYDYLIISEIVIPSECLEYKDDIPAFVNINGTSLKEFHGVKMIDDTFLPTNLLSDFRPEAFKHIKNIYDIISGSSIARKRNSRNVSFDHRIKPGTSLVHYIDLKCPEIPCEVPYKCKNKIREYIEAQLPHDLPAVRGTLKRVADMLHAYLHLAPSPNDNISTLQQAYESIIEALRALEHESTEMNDDERKQPNQEDSPSQVKLLETDSECANIPAEDTTIPKDIDSNGCKETESDKVKIQYTYKCSKDFIPAFPLSGKPKYLDAWRMRQRKSEWPPRSTIDEIYKSEFFVVAKPAVDKPEIEKDFCLAYNIPEIKLARAMTSVQKSVMLIIKAFQKTILEEYSEELTTFHWKTAIYWESECVDHSLFETRTKENILNFLHNVLKRMMSSLCGGNLEHYFVPSNLFAGKKEDAMSEIAKRVAKIQDDPEGVLRMFFIRQTANELKFEFIPRDKVIELLTNYYDEGDYLLVKTLISLFRGFSSEDREVVRKALTHVLTEALPFFIEEEARGRNRDNIGQHLPITQFLLGIKVSKSSLIESCVSLLMGPIYDEGNIDVVEICKTFFTLVLQKVMTDNC